MEGKVSMSFDKKAYQREYMRKRRAAKKCGIVVERFESVEGSTPLPAPPHTSKKETLEVLRRLIGSPPKPPETSEDAPVIVETRSASDVARGIWRNDSGAIISKFAYDKLQKMKEHAKENNFEIDEYSQ